jgi:hypothetical protein
MVRSPRAPADLVRRWFPVILWLALVFFMSTGTFSAENTFSVVRPVLHFLFPGLSSDRVETIHWIIRKGAHVFEYFVLGLLLLRAFRANSSLQWRWRWPLFRPEPHRIDHRRGHRYGRRSLRAGDRDTLVSPPAPLAAEPF